MTTPSPFRQHPALILVSSLVILALLITAGWYWWTTATFKQAIVSQHQATSTSLTKTNQAVADNLHSQASQSATLSTTAVTISEVLSALSNELEQQRHTIPATPHLLWLQLLSAPATQTYAQLAGYYDQAADQAATNAALARYQTDATTILKNISQDQGQTANQQQALAASWDKAAQALANLNPPQPIQDSHDQLLQALKDGQQQLTTLASLYQARNYDGFSAQQKTFSQTIKTINQLADRVTATLTAQDNRLAQDIQQLSSALNALQP